MYNIFNTLKGPVRIPICILFLSEEWLCQSLWDMWCIPVKIDGNCFLSSIFLIVRRKFPKTRVMKMHFHPYSFTKTTALRHERKKQWLNGVMYNRTCRLYMHRHHNMHKRWKGLREIDAWEFRPRKLHERANERWQLWVDPSGQNHA